MATQPHAWQSRSVAIGVPRAGTRAVGTTMTVRRVFAEQPARRKFLRGRQRRPGTWSQIAASWLPAYLEIALRVVLDGKTALETPGDGDPCAAVAGGARLGNCPSMVPISRGRARPGSRSVAA